MEITLAELEQAINYWRELRPASGEERRLSPQVNALAQIYALMIYRHAGALPLATLDPQARDLIQAWQRRSV